MSACRSCGARIVWAVTEKGRRIPLDEEPVADGTFKIDRTGPANAPACSSKSHHATCPQGASWKKTRT